MSERRYFQLGVGGRVVRVSHPEDVRDYDDDPAKIEVQVVPVDAIVIRREDVPKVHVVGGLVTAGEDENGDPYSCSAEANPNWPYWYGINALAVAEYLREHPPVDEEQVKALNDIYADWSQPHNYGIPFGQYLAERGVRVEVKS